MKKQEIKISENKRKKAFTLVELIIVITILAILATIAFVSFSNYTKSSRDANRVSTLTNLQKGLDIYSVQVGRLPVPENPTVFTGGLNGNSLINQGILTQEVLQTLSSTPVDPMTGKEYTYSTFGNGKYYQIAGNLETELSQNLGNQTYANTFQTAKLIGNYRYDPSLPSLIIGSGTTLFSPDTCFVVDGGTNTLENCTIKKSDLPGNTSDSSLRLYYDMNTITGSIIPDLSGNSKHGIGTGGLIINDSILTGSFLGTGIYLDGIGKILVNDFKITNEGTFVINVQSFFYSGDSRSNHRLFHNGDGDGNGGQREVNFGLGGGIDSTLVSAFFGTNTINSGSYKVSYLRKDSTDVLKGKWHQFVVTHINGDSTSIYINGIKLGALNIPYYDFTGIINETLIGGSYRNSGSGFRNLHGIIDEVKIYNRALTDEEIIQQARIAGF